jgi:hypothetical protein
VRCTCFIAAEIVQRDAASGKYSFINIVEDFTSENFPFTLPPFHLVILLERTIDTDGKFIAGFQIKNNETVIGGIEQFPAGITGDRGMIKINLSNYVIAAPGKLECIFKMNESESFTYTITINSALNVGPIQDLRA